MKQHLQIIVATGAALSGLSSISLAQHDAHAREHQQAGHGHADGHSAASQNHRAAALHHLKSHGAGAAQIRKLEKLMLHMHLSVVDLKAAEVKAGLRLRSLQHGEGADLELVHQAIDRSYAAKAALHKSMIRGLFAARGILGDELWKVVGPMAKQHLHTMVQGGGHGSHDQQHAKGHAADKATHQEHTKKLHDALMEHFGGDQAEHQHELHKSHEVLKKKHHEHHKQQGHHKHQEAKAHGARPHLH